jgi:hypothetical protein
MKLKGSGMMRLPGKFVTAVSLSTLGIVALALAAHASFAQQSTANSAKSAQVREPVPALTPFVEEHAHFDECGDDSFSDFARYIRSSGPL